MKELDIREGDRVILYSRDSLLGPSRAYWMFRVYGLDVQILDAPFSVIERAVEEDESLNLHWAL